MGDTTPMNTVRDEENVLFKFIAVISGIETLN